MSFSVSFLCALSGEAAHGANEAQPGRRSPAAFATRGASEAVGLCGASGVAGAAHMRGGTPSTMAPTPLQWDSPKVETRKIWPKDDMASFSSRSLAKIAVAGQQQTPR